MDTESKSFRAQLLHVTQQQKGDTAIDTFLKHVHEHRAHLLHAKLRSMVENLPSFLIDESSCAREQLTGWLKSPRTVGEISALLVALNNGVLLCHENVEGSDWEAEHVDFSLDDCKSLAEAARQGCLQSDLSLKTFEEELMRLGEDDTGADLTPSTPA